MSLKYIATLAAAAVLVLLLGAALRERLLRADSRVVPPSEALALQQLSQEGQLRRMAAFLAERANAAAAFVEYVPSVNAAAMHWGMGDTVVSTRATRPVVALVAPRRDTSLAVVFATDSSVRDWVLVVGRERSGRLISVPALAGGTAVVRCGERQLEEHILGVPLHDELAGAGVFDLSGRVLGLVVRCPTRLVAATTRAVARELTDTASGAALLWEMYGMAVTSLDSTARVFFQRDSGALITRLQRNSAAHLGGLRPGDVISGIDDRSIADAGAVLRAASVARLDSITVARGRRGISLALRIAPNDSLADTTAAGVGIFLTPQAPGSEGVAIATVRPRTAAYAAGLRAGDRLLWVDDTEVTSVSAAMRLLESRSGTSFLIIYERDSVQYGVILTL